MSLIARSRPQPAPAPADDHVGSPGGGRSGLAAGALTAAAALVVFLALVVPDGLGRLKEGTFVPGAFLRIPLEGLLGAAVLLALPPRARRRTAVLLGAGLGVLTILNILNMGFRAVLARRFNPVLDWPLFGDGFNFLTETYGRPAAIAVSIGAVLCAVAVLATVTLAVRRLARLTTRFPSPARRTVTAAVAVWAVFALAGTQLFPGAPVASDNVARLAKSTVLTLPAALRDRHAFTAEAAADAFSNVPGDRLLTALRGKDVVVAVVESYGRSALEEPQMSAIVGPALSAGDRTLAAAGYGSRSGFLTSSTYGGGSWLAHGSFQSGLWINNQQRYNQLVTGERLTLTGSFRRAGWRTVAVEPGNTRAWPEADFYGYDEVYDSRNLGYEGPRFGWSRMPDQFTLAKFQQSVYARRGSTPLMAEVTLTSSHEPWTPLPTFVDWNSIGDGALYAPMARQGEKRSVLLNDQRKARTGYATSIVYSLNSVLSWATTYGDDDLVVVVFGDHQAIGVVSGHNASHDVPISIIAKDPAVLKRASAWGWQDGLRPGPSAPVWKMDEFRDRFLGAYSDGQAPPRPTS